ncbi:MAG: phosphoribosylamine--glycine ligase, partial [Roseiflexus sp.]
MMKILLLGDDGRAHALAWKLINSPRSPEVICAPGNGGTAPFAPSVTLDVADVAGLSRWTFEEQIDLVIPATSAPLHAGLVDEVLSLHIGVWGASRRAA